MPGCFVLMNYHFFDIEEIKDSLPLSYLATLWSKITQWSPLLSHLTKLWSGISFTLGVLFTKTKPNAIHRKKQRRYFFNFLLSLFQLVSVDATKESGRLGRLLNHSRTEANCVTRLVSIKDRPYLILETNRDVKVGEELLYDYGERSKDILQFHEWLKS